MYCTINPLISIITTTVLRRYCCWSSINWISVVGFFFKAEPMRGRASVSAPACCKAISGRSAIVLLVAGIHVPLRRYFKRSRAAVGVQSSRWLPVSIFRSVGFLSGTKERSECYCVVGCRFPFSAPPFMPSCQSPHNPYQGRHKSHSCNNKQTFLFRKIISFIKWPLFVMKN
jgi:hypothetical protein